MLTEDKPMSMRDTIIKIIAEELGVEASLVTDDASLADNLGADSPHLLEMVLGLEEEFEIEITDEDWARFRTVRDVITYIRKRQGG